MITLVSILPISTHLNIKQLRSLCRHSESDAGPRNVVTSEADKLLKLQQQQKLRHVSILPISTYLNVEKLRSLCRHSESNAGPRNVVTSEADVVVVTARVEERVATFGPFALGDVGVESSASEI